MTSKRKGTQGGGRAASVLTAACLAVAVGLAGCDSASSQATKSAAAASNDAGRIARSAGDIRPTQSFLDQLDHKSPDEMKSVAAQAAAAIKADKDNAGGKWKQYFVQNTPSEDLKRAMDILDTAVKSADFTSPAMKSVVQAQLATVTRRDVQVRLSDAQDKLLELTRKSEVLQDQAQYVLALMGQAKVQDARAKVETQDVTAGQQALASSKADLDKAQARVDDLKKQIEQKRTQANGIYADTERQFQAAEQLQGNAAVEAGQKALDTRKQADALMADAATLAIQQTDAENALKIAQIKNAEAMAKLKDAQTAADLDANVAKTATARAAAIREEAKKLVDAEEGLRRQSADFSKSAADLEKQVKAVIAEAGTVDKSYGAAISEYNDAAAKLSAASNENMVRPAVDAKTLLSLQRAAAKVQTGQVNLLGGSVMSLENATAAATAQASEAIGNPGEGAATAPGAADAATAYQQAASAQFKAAYDLASTAAKTSGDASPAKWLGLTLESVAQNGLYLTDHDQATLSAAQDAARAAMAANPFLHLEAMAGDTGAPTPGAPGTPAPESAPATPEAPAAPAGNAPPPPTP